MTGFQVDSENYATIHQARGPVYWTLDVFNGKPLKRLTLPLLFP